MVGRPAGPGQTGASVRVVFNRLPETAAAIDRIARDEVKRAGFEIETEAKRRAPVRTGTLRRSIHTVLSNGDTTATVGPSVLYGAFVEFGTRRMAARPYLRPAAALVLPRFVDRLKSALGRLP